MPRIFALFLLIVAALPAQAQNINISAFLPRCDRNDLNALLVESNFEDFLTRSIALDQVLLNDGITDAQAQLDQAVTLYVEYRIEFHELFVECRELFYLEYALTHQMGVRMVLLASPDKTHAIWGLYSERTAGMQEVLLGIAEVILNDERGLPVSSTIQPCSNEQIVTFTLSTAHTHYQTEWSPLMVHLLDADRWQNGLEESQTQALAMYTLYRDTVVPEYIYCRELFNAHTHFNRTLADELAMVLFAQQYETSPEKRVDLSSVWLAHYRGAEQTIAAMTQLLDFAR